MTNYGYETIGGSTFNFTGGWKHGSKFTVGTAITIASISAYLRDNSPASNIQFAIYSDDGGEPLTRLGMTESISTSTSDPQWYTANFTIPLSLSAGIYWIIESDSGSRVGKYYDAGSSAQTAYNNSVLTDPFGSGITFQDWVMSLYVTTSGPPPPPPAPTPPATGETLVLTNSNGTLWCKPIKWRENQTCTPAIRPLPLASSEFLDADTYVLKPRTIDVVIRLSDREKKVFESIYNYASVSGTNQYTDIYLYYDYGEADAYVWYYQAWISDKDYKWEYSRENGRYVRWWYVTIKLNVIDFSGSSDTLPQYPLSTVTINAGTLDFVLDFARSDKHPPMLPDWINQSEAVDSYLWNECVLDVSYTCRMTNAEKYYMDETLRGHSKVVWEDYIHNLFSIAGAGNGVWVSSIEAQWDDINWEKPWKLTVAIQANNSEIESRSGNLLVDSLAYPSGTNHLGVLYLDELPNPQGLPSSQSVDVGVHILYFFLPTQALSFHDWEITGGVIVLDEQDFDRESILTVLITDDCTIYPRYDMAVSPTGFTLDSYLDGDPSTHSYGEIDVDGNDYSLPHLLAIISGGSHTLEYIPDPCQSWQFSRWEVSSNITVIDIYANPTTFTVDSGVLGTITAIFSGDYSVGLSTNFDNPCYSVIKLVIGGVAYYPPTTYYEFQGDYTTTIDLSYNQYQYVFDHWETTGEVTVENDYDLSTIMYIRGDGTLKAILHPIDLTWTSHKTVITDPCEHFGKIGWYLAGQGYQYEADPLTYHYLPLPNWSTWGPWQIRWDPKTSGKIFDHWETSGGVSVDNPNTQVTNMTVTDSGTITAVYRDA